MATRSVAVVGDRTTIGGVSRSKLLLSINVLTGLLMAASVVFFVYALFVHVDLASVRTGAPIFYAGLALFIAASLTMVQLPLVVFALVRRPAIRIRVAVTFVAGIVVFVASFMLDGEWVERQLPPSHVTAPR
ncbi:hypothetical protein ACS7SF_10630 [Ralstonia sp. 25C]|uniref:hypothetical protein n=1 Tax=Ralstonia sp. 25C TaxID=3447363 RepID=UPI003F755AD6